MEILPEPAQERRKAPTRLIWVLAALAVASSGVAAFAWTQGRDTTGDPTLPSIVTQEQLDAGNLGAEDEAPDFTVPTLDGTNFSLSGHFAASGRPVLLNLWASWCLPCRSEMPALEAASQRHPNIEFVGVAVQDDPVAAEAFAKEIGISYTIGLDEREEVNALYPNFGLPTTYLISPEGLILETMVGEVDEARIDAVIATFFGG